MSLYAVVLNNPDESVMARAKKELGNRMYVVTDHLALVSPEQTVLTDNVSDMFGIDKDTTGLVIEIENYSGFNQKALWEWMEKFS